MAKAWVQSTVPCESFRSWPFRLGEALIWLFGRLFGFWSMVILLAVVANIPVFQLLSFGYLLESSGRIGRTGRIGSGFPGLRQASRIAGGLLGSYLCLVPLWIVSNQWYAAYLVEPSSSTAQFLRVAQALLLAMTLSHLLAAWFCGGQLRQFVWPLVAPLAIFGWLLRRFLSCVRVRHWLQRPITWIAPRLLEDIDRLPPLTDWFLPAMVYSRIRHGELWSRARDQLWEFFASIPFKRLAYLGFWGFVGTSIWLCVPTCLLITTTTYPSPISGLIGVLGTWLATIVFTMLLPLQTQFAVELNFRQLFDVRATWLQVRRAPHWYLTALLLALILASPLFLAKVEEIPRELWWLLSFAYVLAGWLGRVAFGCSYAAASKRSVSPSRWWALPLMAVMVPISFAFVLMMFFTRYVSWHGAWSMIENPVFLLPAPFWL